MAQLYADLRFAKVMGGRSMASQALEAALSMNEAESPYDNMQPALAGQDGDGAQPSPGRWSRRWCLPVGLLATCLLLVALSPTLSPDWQVTRSLQDTSREHMAEQGRLSQELRAREQSLEQTQLELAWAREELQRAWHEGNISQLELNRLNTELRRVTGVLSKTEREVQEVQGRLNNSENTVALLRSCTAIDCCPSGWLLYRGKCLFISSEKKTWEDSRDECEKTYSQLLITKSWSRWTVPTFLKNADVPYWIGLQKGSFPWYEYSWLEEEDPESEGVSEAWFWVDGSLYERPWQSKSNGTCAIISRGSIKPTQCTGPKDLNLWICEKAAGPSLPFR
ncbi:B-cell differentiation antigen CD72 [Corvus brachyrhynchos]|uniref:B-cell differentiation antigen CD72 n=1 Tax=Corvus brachyrhynchos TaxID=85066 RepID=A0A091E822_CORBR|nr:PREDICTED: B-cell differentiation antigen CD72 [Corvus brachyrhynchos]KFO52817.1 B-cell differentiation antigen CD72 [Corvus brachyrhynchos]